MYVMKALSVQVTNDRILGNGSYSTRRRMVGSRSANLTRVTQANTKQRETLSPVEQRHQGLFRPASFLLAIRVATPRCSLLGIAVN